jgi:cytochrome P450 family 20 subfamily A
MPICSESDDLLMTASSIIFNVTFLTFSNQLTLFRSRFAYMVTAVLVSVLLKRLRLLAVDRQVFEMKYELVTSAREEAWITVSKRH